MKAKIYYCVGGFSDTIIIEAKDNEELIDRINEELGSRGAIYTGAEILEY